MNVNEIGTVINGGQFSGFRKSLQEKPFTRGLQPEGGERHPLLELGPIKNFLTHVAEQIAPPHKLYRASGIEITGIREIGGTEANLPLAPIKIFNSRIRADGGAITTVATRGDDSQPAAHFTRKKLDIPVHVAGHYVILNIPAFNDRQVAFEAAQLIGESGTVIELTCDLDILSLGEVPDGIIGSNTIFKIIVDGKQTWVITNLVPGAPTFNKERDLIICTIPTPEI